MNFTRIVMLVASQLAWKETWRSKTVAAPKDVLVELDLSEVTSRTSAFPSHSAKVNLKVYAPNWFRIFSFFQLVPRVTTAAPTGACSTAAIAEPTKLTKSAAFHANQLAWTLSSPENADKTVMKDVSATKDSWEMSAPRCVLPLKNAQVRSFSFILLLNLLHFCLDCTENETRRCGNPLCETTCQTIGQACTKQPIRCEGKFWQENLN